MGTGWLTEAIGRGFPALWKLRLRIGHIELAFVVGAFINNERLCVHFAAQAAARHDLETATAIDFAVQIAGDSHIFGLDLGIDVGALGDEECALALDRAFYFAVNAKIAIGLKCAVEDRMPVDHAERFGRATVCEGSGVGCIRRHGGGRKLALISRSHRHVLRPFSLHHGST